jgi:hypothetical protein
LEADTSDNRVTVEASLLALLKKVLPPALLRHVYTLRVFQWPLTPVQDAFNNRAAWSNSSSAPQPTIALAKPFSSTTNNYMLINLQMLSLATLSNADGALTAGTAHMLSNCRPVRVSRVRRACSLVRNRGYARYASSRNLLLQRQNVRPTPRTRPAHGVEENPTACIRFRLWPAASASARAVDMDGRYRCLSRSAVKCYPMHAVPQVLRLGGGGEEHLERGPWDKYQGEPLRQGGDHDARHATQRRGAVDRPRGRT